MTGDPVADYMPLSDAEYADRERRRAEARVRARIWSGDKVRRFVARILAEQGDTCHLCEQPGATTVDHIIPRSKGGAPFDPANVRPAHLGCNSARKDRELVEFLRARDRGQVAELARRGWIGHGRPIAPARARPSRDWFTNPTPGTTAPTSRSPRTTTTVERARTIATADAAPTTADGDAAAVRFGRPNASRDWLGTGRRGG